MKVSYNWLKDFVNIRVSPRVLADKLTMAGLEVVSLQRVEDDWVLEIEVTSNRPDLLSIKGIAREIAAIKSNIRHLPPAQDPANRGEKTQIKNVQIQKRKQEKTRDLAIEIRDKSACRQYIGTIIEGVKIEPSPEWMQKRLKAVGVRPINNVVDITNYVLYETGQPLHAFDLDKIITMSSCRYGAASPVKIVVRRAKRGEEIVTLDGMKRILDENILVIADTNRPIAVAGVCGGEDTAVTFGTKNILLESAEFNPVLIRKGVRSLGVSTDSSYRFERKVNPQGVPYASQRAAGLISQVCAGKTALVRSQSVGKTECQKVKILLSIDNVERLLGLRINVHKIRQILSSLGFISLILPFSSKARGGSICRQGRGEGRQLVVSIPSFRLDLVCEEDLIEEIARVYGYDKILPTVPYILPRAINNLGGRRTAHIIRRTLVGLGFTEVINYSMGSGELFRKNGMEGVRRPIRIENPLSKEQEILRTDLFSGLLNNIAYNINRRNSHLKIFELGKIFCRQNDAGQLEDLALGLAATGRLRFDWQRPDDSGVSFFDLKGALGRVLLDLGMGGFNLFPQDYPLFKQGVSFDVRAQARSIGLIGEVSPEALDNYSITAASMRLREKGVFLFQILVKGISARVKAGRTFKPYSVYPSIRRDISLLISREIRYATIVEIIYCSGREIISDVKLLEQYIGPHTPEGFKSLLLCLEYSSLTRTLKDEEVDAVHSQIIDNLVEKLAVQIR